MLLNAVLLHAGGRTCKASDLITVLMDLQSQWTDLFEGPPTEAMTHAE